jgi:hypothetical protein
MIIILFFRLCQQIIPPRNKSGGEHPFARRILMPTPFRRHLRVGVWARVSLMIALGCDYYPVRGDNIGETIDNKKHYNQP